MEQISVKKLLMSEFQVSEAVKVLRTNVLFSGVNNRCIALTSCNANEGKTTIFLQLAASLAESGKRVLLMDADLRKSVLAGRLRYRGKVQGLSHFLSGMANADELLYETDIKKLYIMFAGQRVPNPAELLGGESFQKLVEALKQSFDYVIIDTAPLGQVIDCAVMSPIVDGVIMVIDATNNNYKAEQRVKQQIEKAGGKVLGAVLNRIDYSDSNQYYGKNNAYSYGETK